MIKTLIVPCLIDGAGANTASYRFRALWPSRYWPEAELYQQRSQWIGAYDSCLFQKAYLSDRARAIVKMLRDKGKVLGFDITDPDWLTSPTHRSRLLEMLPMMDFATCPTEPLAEWLRTYVPTHVIPDRLDLAEFPKRLRHKQSDSWQPSCIWFGYAHNIAPLHRLWATIEERKLPLTVLSNACPMPWDKRARFVTWTERGANAEIARHDIALVPKVHEYKSDNRAVTAAALGVIPVSNANELEPALDPAFRAKAADRIYDMARREYDVRESVEDWRHLFAAYHG